MKPPHPLMLSHDCLSGLLSSPMHQWLGGLHPVLHALLDLALLLVCTQSCTCAQLSCDSMAASSALSPSCHHALPLLSYLQIPITVIKDPAAYFVHESSETHFVVVLSSQRCSAGIVSSEESGDRLDLSYACLFFEWKERNNWLIPLEVQTRMLCARGTECHWAANLCSLLSIHVLTRKTKSLLEEFYCDNPCSLFCVGFLFFMSFEYQITEKFLLHSYQHLLSVQCIEVIQFPIMLDWACLMSRSAAVM